MNKTGEMLCYSQVVNNKTVWGNKSPLLDALPAIILQMAVTMGSNLFFLYILRPLHQPRIVIDILGALVVSPFIMGTISEKWVGKVWPEQGGTNLDMLAHLGLLYAVFIKGLQMDFTPITHRRGTTTLALSLGVITLPFLAGTALSFFFHYYEIKRLRGHSVFMYWGAVIASSSFPTFAAIVARLKLLCTDLGRSALSIGLVNDVGSWVLIIIIIALSALPPPSESNGLRWAPFFSVISFTVCFMAFCFGVIRPCIAYSIKDNKEGENFSDSTIHVLLFMVMASGMVAEFFGAYAFLGAFLLGLSIPHGFLAQTLVEKMDDCINGILIPLYLVTVGMLMNPPYNFFFVEGGFGLMLIVFSALVKPLCVFLFSTLCAVPFRDGIALSVLLNAKGLLSIVIVSVGFERKHLTSEAVTMLVFVILVSTLIVEPVMAFAYNRFMKSSVLYDNRTVSGLKADEEFRVISCIHGPRNIPGMVNLLEASSVSRMSVFPLHLLELLGRSSAMLIVHESHGSSSKAFERPDSSPDITKTRVLSEQINNSFESYQRQHSETASVQTLTIVSPMDTMHEDICSLAEEKQVSMILLPFHKNQGMDGRLEDDGNIEIRSVNQNVMSTSPCSLGLLIDRGIGMLPIGGSGGSSRRGSRLRAVVFFFGGPDDREALSYARRLARHSLVSLTVIRFVAGSDPVDVKPIIFPGDEENEAEKGVQTIYTENDLEKQMDNRFVARLLDKSESKMSIQYVEKASNSGADTVGLMREMDHRNYDLYIVGRGRQVLSPMTAGLLEWSECPELGAIGDVLVTSDVAPEVSVLVVQQYAGARDLPPRDATVVEF